MNLDKSVHNALWGSESWEISAHTSDPSVIADGEGKGRRLNENYPNFPLLFKVINAQTRLSVQVHPNENTCKVTGGEPKTERDVRGLSGWSGVWRMVRMVGRVVCAAREVGRRDDSCVMSGE